MAIKVLFLCVHNSGRSQMAEALLNHLGDGKFLGESAGYDPKDLNPYVVKVMKEHGLDISNNKSKDVFDLYREGRIYRYVISVCEDNEAERCPIFPGTITQFKWPFKNPETLTGSETEILDQIRSVYALMKIKIEEFIPVALNEYSNY